MKPVNVGVLGLGTVGGGTVNVLTRNAEEITRRAGRGIVVTHAAARDPDKPRICDTTGITLTQDPFEVVNDPDIQIVVELIGGDALALELVMKAIENGKHVVTANKALIAKHGNEIFTAAQKQGVMVAFEAAVAGGIPIIKAIREGLAGNRIEWLAGIVRQTGGEEVGERRGLMLLTVDLRDFHLPDLVKLIVSGRHSGTLTVTDGSSTRTLSVHDGRPVCATSCHLDGEVLDPDQVLNDIYDLFRWQEGAFTFDQRMGPQEGCLVLQISADNLILAGSRWVDNWAMIQRVVPSSDTVFERREGTVEGLDLIEEEPLAVR